MNDPKKQSRRDRIVAIALTVLLYLGIIALCVFTCLRFPPDGEELPLPQPEEDGVLFGGEYVMLGDNPQLDLSESDQPAPTEGEEAAQDGLDIEDGGEAAPEPAPVVTSKQESPMKVKEKPKPEKTGPTKEDLAKQEKERKEKEAAERIKNKVKFGSGGSGSGQSGSPDGNASTGAVAGSPGHNLSGRTIESFTNPSSTLSGTIRVRVKVNAKGQVVSATYAGGSGAAAGNATVRQNCVNASLKSRFSVLVDSNKDQSGEITWRFK